MKIPDQDYDTLLDDVFIQKIVLIYTYITFNEILVYKTVFWSIIVEFPKRVCQ